MQTFTFSGQYCVDIVGSKCDICNCIDHNDECYNYKFKFILTKRLNRFATTKDVIMCKSCIHKYNFLQRRMQEKCVVGFGKCMSINHNNNNKLDCIVIYDDQCEKYRCYECLNKNVDNYFYNKNKNKNKM